VTPCKDGSGSGPLSGGSIISQNIPATPARKDPNEEFFMMTFLSYKLNHREYDRILAVIILIILKHFRLMEKISSKK